MTPSVTQLSADIIFLVVSCGLQFYFRFFSGWFETKKEPSVQDFFSLLVILVVYWLIFFWLSGLYKNWYIRSPIDEWFQIIKTSFAGNFIIFFFVFLDSVDSPRLTFLFYFALMTVIMGLGRFFERKLQVYLRKKGLFIIPSIIVGNYKKTLELANKINNSPAWGFRNMGMVLIDNPKITNQKEDETPILGYIDEFSTIIKENHPKEILITVEKADHNLLLKIVGLCNDAKIPVKIIPDLYDIFSGMARTLPVYGIPLIEINTLLLKPWEAFIKRTLDIVFSACVIIIGMPLWLIIAVIIKCESKGPVFYKQERVGKSGKNFIIYKFRSMVQNAEKNGPQWAQCNDPRVTKFGKFMRSSHLDEIPQFWNVIKGEMSLVGPRPERPFFVDKYSEVVPFYKRRLLVRPGITGWWQVRYTVYEESVEEIEDRLKDDFYYIENISFKLDIEIILRTVLLMIKGHGQT